MTEPTHDVEGPQDVPNDADADEENDSKEYWVKTPWHTDVLDGRGLFPTITPDGVKMTGAEKREAKKAADQLHIRLLVKEAE